MNHFITAINIFYFEIWTLFMWLCFFFLFDVTLKCARDQQERKKLLSKRITCVRFEGWVGLTFFLFIIAQYGNFARRRLNWFNLHPYVCVILCNCLELFPVRSKLMLYPSEHMPGNARRGNRREKKNVPILNETKEKWAWKKDTPDAFNCQCVSPMAPYVDSFDWYTTMLSSDVWASFFTFKLFLSRL